MSTPATAFDPDAPRDPLRILFLALGNAGMQLIAHLPRRVPELHYAAIDTDAQALEACKFENKLLIGEGKTGGLGTGSNPDLARECAEAQDEELVDLLRDMRVVILVGGLGGGTCGGVGPYLAERARDLGCVVLAAVVRPMEAEGGHRRHAADAALAHFREHCQAVTLFPLDVLREDNDMTLQRLISRCGLEISRALGGLAVLLRTGWLLPLTIQDIIQVMQRADGYCRLVAVSSDGDDRLPDALDMLFSHPLIDKGSLLAHSGGVVVGILCGPKTTVRELELISAEIRSVLRSDAELKIGVAQDERFGSHLALVAMVAERWSERAVALEVVNRVAGNEGGDAAGDAENPPADPKLVQGEIDLGANANTRGRFKGAEPTIVEGTDLDTPTFIRKGIRLSPQTKR